MTAASCPPADEPPPGPLLDQGVEGGPDEVREQLARGAEAGASIASFTVSWADLRPRRSEPYDWSRLDPTVDLARAAGMRIRLRVLGTPGWATTGAGAGAGGSGAARPPLTPHELASWSAFVADLLRHLGGRVDYLEVWNEPNDRASWSTGPDAAAYAALLRATYDVVQRADPDVVVVSGALRGVDLAYLAQVYDALEASGGRPAFDMVGLHPFGAATAPDGDPVWPYGRRPFDLGTHDALDLSREHAVMRQNGDSDGSLYLGDVADADGTVPPHRLAGAWGSATCAPYVFALASGPRRTAGTELVGEVVSDRPEDGSTAPRP